MFIKNFILLFINTQQNNTQNLNFHFMFPTYKRKKFHFKEFTTITNEKFVLKTCHENVKNCTSQYKISVKINLLLKLSLKEIH